VTMKFIYFFKKIDIGPNPTSNSNLVWLFFNASTFWWRF